MLLVGGGLAVHAVLEAAHADVSSPGPVSQLVTSARPSERPLLGYVRPAEAAPTAATPAVAPTVGAAAAPTIAPTVVPSPSPAGDRVRVANTDGQGVALYSAPRREARLQHGFVEGTPLTVLERAGPSWARVRSDDGQEGWVGATYLTAAP